MALLLLFILFILLSFSIKDIIVITLLLFNLIFILYLFRNIPYYGPIR